MHTHKKKKETHKYTCPQSLTGTNCKPGTHVMRGWGEGVWLLAEGDSRGNFLWQTSDAKGNTSLQLQRCLKSCEASTVGWLKIEHCGDKQHNKMSVKCYYNVSEQWEINLCDWLFEWRQWGVLLPPVGHNVKVTAIDPSLHNIKHMNAQFVV